MTAIPLVVRDGAEPFARLEDRTITVAEFCADVQTLASGLPTAAHVINLVQDRYLFTVAFYAALTRGQTVLLPSHRELGAAPAVSQQFDRTIVIGDADDEHLDFRVALQPGGNGSVPSPLCESSHAAVIVFTSGSTGTPQPHVKTWGLLDNYRHHHRAQLERQLGTKKSNTTDLVATVPSWHMYGLEWALLLPTVAPLRIFCGADFYPADVRAALGGADADVVLVSTPLHLRALRAAGAADADNVALTLCATAPLANSLATDIEQGLNTTIWEIYGCSEIGSVASRRPTQQQAWEFFDWFDLAHNDRALTLGHALLPAPVTLADQFVAHGAGSFLLEGRNTDIIKIGGKRESLAHLNNVLLQLAGVEDGLFFQPASFGLPDRGRLEALVVAPDRSVEQLRQALAEQLPPAFLPRPLRRVASLPRDETSKLKRSELQQLLHKLRDADV
ncbi:MAG: AMP-binding protein [Pseudomonadota bacterium]